MSGEPEIGGERADRDGGLAALLTRARSFAADALTRAGGGERPSRAMSEARALARETLERGREGARAREAELWARYRALTKERRSR